MNNQNEYSHKYSMYEPGEFANSTNFDGNIVICFTGDTMLGRDIVEDYDNHYLENSFDSKFRTHSMETIYDNYLLNNYLKKCDLLVGNLETTITNHNEKDKKTFNYRIREANMGFLKINKNQFFSIANNHILDYNEKGMSDTIKNLQRMDIKFSGAGKNLFDAQTIAKFTIKGKRIGILGCTDHYEKWKASATKPGIYFIDYNNYNELLSYISSIKKELDILILSIHWGQNYKNGIDDKYQKFAKKVINAGIDIIHGHSSHHIKCIRTNGKKIIIYGNGDFINDYAIDSQFRNDLGMIVRISIKRDNSFDIYVVPTQIQNKKVSIFVSNPDKEFICNKINEDCNKPSILHNSQQIWCPI
jgi:poly-gamma-glutamate capsule biosynthesis protein CapA/YwtB (metallophosphatase superfamily)